MRTRLLLATGAAAALAACSDPVGGGGGGGDAATADVPTVNDVVTPTDNGAPTDAPRADAGGDAGRVSKLGAEYTQAEADLQAAMEEWERLVS